MDEFNVFKYIIVDQFLKSLKNLKRVELQKIYARYYVYKV